MIEWIAALIGWRIGGFFGAIIGYFIGTGVKRSLFARGIGGASGSRAMPQENFPNYLLFLSAIVIKAKGSDNKHEQAFVRNTLINQFGEARATEAFRNFNVFKTTHANTSTQDLCNTMRHELSYASRLQLIEFMFNIAKIDGFVDSNELLKIEEIAGYLGIAQGNFLSIKKSFVSDVNSAYKLLNLDASASDAEVKSAYRKMVKLYHPDKLRDLDGDKVTEAETKFRAIQEAYEEIKKRRNFCNVILPS